MSKKKRIKIVSFSIQFIVILVSICSIKLNGQPFDLYRLFKGTFVAPNTNIYQMHGMTKDVYGNVYVCGSAVRIMATPGAYRTTYAGANPTGFVMKLSADLTTVIWATYLGGTNMLAPEEWVAGIAVASNGDVVVTAHSYDPSYPVTDTSDINYINTGYKLFVTRLNSTGTQIVYSRLIGYESAGSFGCASTYYGYNSSVVIAPSGDAYVYAPLTYPRNDQNRVLMRVTQNALFSTRQGGCDLGLAKVTPTGAISYCSYVGGSGDDYIGNVYYHNGKVYLTGMTKSANFPAIGNRTPDSMGDAFIMAWNDAAVPTPVSTLVFGGSNEDWCKEMVFNPTINAFIADGATQSSDFPYTKTLQQGQVTGGFVSAVNPDLSGLMFTTMLGTGLLPCSVRARSNGDVAVISSLNSATTTLPVTPGAFKTVNTGIEDRAVIVLTANGDLRYASFIGGCYNDFYRTYRNTAFLEVVELGSCSWRLITGAGSSFSTYSFPTTSGTYQPVYPGGYAMGVCIFQTSRPDSAIITSRPTCGEYLFTGTTSGFGACAAINTFFNFGDGGGWQSGNPATHLYTKNGTYQVSMKVAYPGGDTSYWNTTLTVQSQPTVRVTPQVMYRCSKDSGRIAMASGAVRYEWRPKAGLSDSTVASPRVRPMQNTKYYVRGYDANGCYADDSVQVFVSTITASVSTADTAVCAGASVSLKASGAQTISWFPSSGLNTTKGASVIATPTQTTEYRVIVAEGDCADTGRVLVRVARAPRLQLSPPATVCTGGSTQLSATVFSTDSLDTVGVRFVWKPSATLSNVNVSNPVATPSKTTRYVCTAVNRFGCVRTDSVEVKVQPTLELTLSADTSVCLGSSVMLKAGGGAMYSWSPKDGLNDSTKAAPICTPTKDMTYTVMTWSGDFFTATCRDTAIVHVRVFPFPGIHASGSQTICPQTPVVLRARVDSSSLQGLMPVWYNEDGTVIGTGDSISVQPDSTSLYRVRIRHAQGCESQDSVRVTVSQRLAVRARALSPVVAGSSVILSVEYRQDGAEYTWTKPGGQVVGNGDSCRVTITQRECFIVYGKRGGCDGWDTVCVDIAPDQKVVACEAVRLCRGDSAKLYVLNPQKNTTYSWRAEDNSWNANGDTVVYPALRTGTCYVVATNGLSTSTDSVTVTVFQPPVLSARDTAVCRNTAIVLVVEDTSADDLIEWRDASDRVVSTARTLFLASPSSSSYTIRATSQQGCVSTVSMRLDVNPTVVVSFGLETADTLQPGSMAMINLVAQSNATVTPLHVRAQIGLPSKMISGASGTMLGDTLLITLDTVVSINTSPQVIASLRALCLVSSYEHGVMELRDVAVDTLTSCIEVRKSSRPFVVSHTCGNTLIGIELEPSMINISTGLAGEVLVSCTDQVVVYDIMGRTIAMSDQPPKNGGQSILRLSGLPAGVYAVRSVSNRSALTFVIP